MAFSGEVPDTQPIEFFNKLNSGGISLAGVDGLNNHSFDIVIPVYKDDIVIAFVLAGDKEEDAPYYANYLHILPYWHYADE